MGGRGDEDALLGEPRPAGRRTRRLSAACSKRRRRRRAAALAAAVGVATLCLLVLWRFWHVADGADFTVYYELLSESVNQSFCTLPNLDPWDPSIRKYLTAVEPINCKRLQPEATVLSDGVLYLNGDELRAAGHAPDRISCQFRCFRRAPGDDFTIVYDNEWQSLTNGTKTSCEFVETRCYSSGFSPTPFYANAHAQFLPNNNNNNNNNNGSNWRPSVLLFVVDSVSRSNWFRSLPKSLAVLRDNYNAIVFDGFTKVADNSFPNAVAFLTGKRAQVENGDVPELPEDMIEGHFDDWPLVWRQFKASGYATFYAEDFVDFNLFTYLSRGFRKQPTDGYFRPFWLHAAKSFLFRRSSSYCYGNRPNHRLQLDYLSKFLRVQSAGDRRRPFFALHWLTELSHDWMNQVGAADDDLTRFFVEAQSQLEDTFVFVLADHGHRFDRIRRSLVGRIEERMPFFAMAPPTRLRADVTATLRQNAKELTTFWDLYVTLRDILWRSETGNWTLPLTAGSTTETRWAPRGHSLLTDVPARRDCVAAGVPPEFCVCQREHPLALDDAAASAAAHALEAHVNGALAGPAAGGRCAPLVLTRITSAQVFLPNIDLIRSPPLRNFFFAGAARDFFLLYRVSIELAPSGAALEATVRHQLPADDYTVVGDVNRINKYGNQSVCVRSPILRKFCYCI